MFSAPLPAAPLRRRLRDPLESANPGAGMVSFTVPAPETGNVELEVTLTPL